MSCNCHVKLVCVLGIFSLGIPYISEYHNKIMVYRSSKPVVSEIKHTKLDCYNLPPIFGLTIAQWNVCIVYFRTWHIAQRKISYQVVCFGNKTYENTCTHAYCIKTKHDSEAWTLVTTVRKHNHYLKQKLLPQCIIHVMYVYTV